MLFYLYKKVQSDWMDHFFFNKSLKLWYNYLFKHLYNKIVTDDFSIPLGKYIS
jgi:hypothetical protein